MRTDRASRVIAAAPATLYGALTDPEALAAWLPPAGMTGEVQAFEPRPGGRFRIALRHDSADARGKSGDNVDIVEGSFAELALGERVVWETEFVSDDPAFAGTMRMTWQLVPVAGGTRVEIVCEDVPEGISAEDHAEGLAASLANLAAFAERSD